MNYLENSADTNYFVAFAVNSIGFHGYPTAISDNLFQDGTVISGVLDSLEFAMFASRTSNVAMLFSTCNAPALICHVSRSPLSSVMVMVPVSSAASRG